mmetsp:Transcript_121383/g.189510  ORF Transcript_121383/g.189510 Transcript_121383/m.189510 type:complete len:86 (+) Transcript_121383:219-476(+)
MEQKSKVPDCSNDSAAQIKTHRVKHNPYRSCLSLMRDMVRIVTGIESANLRNRGSSKYGYPVAMPAWFGKNGVTDMHPIPTVLGT